MKTFLYYDDGVGSVVSKINQMILPFDLAIQTSPILHGEEAKIIHKHISPNDEEMSEDKLFRIGLIRICELLHMSATGSSDPLGEMVRKSMIAYLEKRLSSWKTCITSRFFAYDESIRQLVITTIKEYYHIL